MAYFAVCIFLSAFLLFQIQPMIARYILPWFGGTPAVWSTVQMFFQVLLTGGYAYAAWLTGRAKRRETVHLVLLGASAVLMIVLGFTWKSPITPDAGWKPLATTYPVLGILKVLLVSVGLPYFLLSTNSPLLQAWFHRTFPDKTAYRLYALSNVGSLLGLVAYPVLVEPTLTLAWQGRLWSLAYLVYAGLAAYGAARALHRNRSTNPEPVRQAAGPEPRPAARDIVLWIVLAAAASILLLATTNHITQELAVIPFLWVLPLTIYLLTFILAFSGERWYPRQFFLILFFVSTALYGWTLVQGEKFGFVAQIGIYLLLLFAACMVCHGELFRLRPHPARLTSFYLMVSVGGAIGGIFTTFIAPSLFKGYWELPLNLSLCWLLFFIKYFSLKSPQPRPWLYLTNILILASMLLASIAMAYKYIRADLTGSLVQQRNFYGVVRVQKMNFNGGTESFYGLVHGATLHGLQAIDQSQENLPTTYYSRTSGVGLALLNHPQRDHGMRVGVLGLGIGTLAAYGQPGDVYRFYEINPAVVSLAEGQGGYFSYLSASQAQVEIVPGDARLSLEAELAASQPQEYDVLVMDVFSSDSIPVHLLDSEAFDLYLKHLSADGILAVHTSNRYLDLSPVVWTLADHFGLSRVLIEDSGNSAEVNQSEWILLSRNPALLEDPAIRDRAAPMQDYVSHVRLWTDDYSNLFQILRH